MRNRLIALLLLAIGTAAWCMRNPFGLSADEQLLAAASLRDTWSLRQALASGASVDARDNSGMTALMWAATTNDEESVRNLLAAGADVSARLGSSYTALCFAANKNATGIVRMLLAAGAQVDERGYCDGTPLHNAAAASSVEAARLLLAHGADVNARDSAGRTPLILAASNMGTDEMIQLLVESGADPSIVDSDHHTALDCANMESAEDAARIRSSVARATVVSDTRQVSRSSK